LSQLQPNLDADGEWALEIANTSLMLTAGLITRLCIRTTPWHRISGERRHLGGPAQSICLVSSCSGKKIGSSGVEENDVKYMRLLTHLFVFSAFASLEIRLVRHAEPQRCKQSEQEAGQRFTFGGTSDKEGPG
jgi:hypothetical protein